MSLNHGFLTRVFLGGGAMAIALSATAVQASPFPDLQPEGSGFEASELDSAIDLEVAETAETPVDLAAAFADSLTGESGLPTAAQSGQWFFAEQSLVEQPSAGQRPQEDSPETWVATADNLIPLANGPMIDPGETADRPSAPALAQVRPANEGDGWEFVLDPISLCPLA